jgi:hypothetical protein
MKRRARGLTIVTGVSGVAALTVAGLFWSVATRTAKEDIREVAERAAAQYREMVSRVEGSLAAARDYEVDPADMDTARRYFTTQVFPRFKKLAGISLSERSGSSYYLLNNGTLKDVRAEGRYEPEKRGWFKGAVTGQASGTCHWTDSYEFITLQELGITAALSWKNNHGNDVVVAYDVLLDDYSTMVSNITHRASSLTFVFESVGDEASIYVSDANKGLAEKGFETWQNQVRQEEPGVTVRAKRIARDIWWCGFAPVDELNPSKWICVMVPRDSVIGAGLVGTLYAGITAILIAVTITVYLIFSRKRSEPLFDGEMDAGQIRALIEKGENRMVEFKSTMRMNLHSKKPGREIEVAWLKGVAAFLNTDGGTLLLGITDAGEITGLEQDVFENDDKCRLHFKNLIAKGLGADVSKFIRFSLVPLEGKTVGVVECLKASRAVYLKDGNKETFYIRNGPSSDELPVSRVVEYIAEHWK